MAEAEQQGAAKAEQQGMAEAEQQELVDGGEAGDGGADASVPAAEPTLGDQNQSKVWGHTLSPTPRVATR
jgi:hypothetical protein